jgi:hypothetical protein
MSDKAWVADDALLVDCDTGATSTTDGCNKYDVHAEFADPFGSVVEINIDGRDYTVDGHSVVYDLGDQ